MPESPSDRFPGPETPQRAGLRVEAVGLFVAFCSIVALELHHVAHMVALFACLGAFCRYYVRWRREDCGTWIDVFGSKNGQKMVASLAATGVVLGYFPSDGGQAKPHHPKVSVVTTFAERSDHWLDLDHPWALLASGSELWSFYKGGTATFPDPAVSGGAAPVLYKTSAPGTASASDDSVVATIRGGRLIVRDGQSGTVLYQSHFGTGTGPLAVGLGSVFVCDGSTSKIYRFYMRSWRHKRIAVPGPVNGIVVVGRRVYAATNETSRGPGSLVQLDLATNTDTDPRALPPNARLIGFALGRFWFSVPGSPDDTLVGYALNTSVPPEEFPMDYQPLALVASDHDIVTYDAHDELLLINPWTKHVTTLNLVSVLPNVSGLTTADDMVILISSSDPARIVEYGWVRKRVAGPRR